MTQKLDDPYAVISLKDISVIREDKNAFRLISGSQEFFIKTNSEENAEEWVQKLSSLNTAYWIHSTSFYTPTTLPLSTIQKRCNFSSAIRTSENFLGGTFSDIIKYVLLHSSEPSSGKYIPPGTRNMCTNKIIDNLMLTGLLVVVKQYNVFDLFLNTSEEVFKDRLQSQKKKSKSVEAWKSRISNFVAQICRSYRLFTGEKRHMFYDMSLQYTSKQEPEIKHLCSIEEENFQITEVRPLHVSPQWKNQSNVQYVVL